MKENILGTTEASRRGTDGALGSAASHRGAGVLWEPRHLWEQPPAGTPAGAGNGGAAGSGQPRPLPDEPDCQTLSWQANLWERKR